MGSNTMYLTEKYVNGILKTYPISYKFTMTEENKQTTLQMNFGENHHNFFQFT